MSNDPNEEPDRQNIFLAAIPLYHVYGMIALCVTSIKRGEQFVIMPKFDFPKYLEAIERYKITHLSLVPPLLVALLKSPLVDKFDLSSVVAMGVGGAPAGKELIDATAKLDKDVFLGQGYGMTETCGSIAYAPALSNLSAPYASVGLLLAHMEAKVVDVDSGKALPPNQRRKLCLRGPCVMEGYLNNEKATAETLDNDQWLHTGDVAYFDADGWLFIVDRLKELIKYKGLQVAPAELESVLHSHNIIEEAAVVGFSDEQTGQLPVAFVVRKRGSLTEEDVINFVAKQVAPYKNERKVVFVESIPKSPAGKILRKELKASQTSTL